jgi:hypothetical protein
MAFKSKISILIYTHSDYSFIWPALIGQMKEYIGKDIEVHFGYNNTIDDIINYNIPDDWIQHTYKDGIVWTKRVNSLLKEIDSEYILFIHEDWIPTNNVSKKILLEACNFMDTVDCGFLLSYSHFSVTDSQDGIFTGYEDYYYYEEDSHIFQPAIWKKTVFSEFCEVLNKEKNQNEDTQCLAFMRNKKCYSVQNLKTVRQYRTTNSLIFPHMHCLSEGLWNFTKYPTLKKLLDDYGIDTNSRGIHTWWELDTQ